MSATTDGAPAAPPRNGPAADNSPAGLTAQLSEVWSAIASLGRDLSPEQWDRPTACPGWSVKDQLVHVIGTESMLAGLPTPDAEVGDLPHVRNDIGRFNEAWVIGLADLGGPAVLARFEELAADRLAALGALDPSAWDEPGWTPVGQAPYRRFMQIRIFDCWVHLQDMREALDPRAGGGEVAEADGGPAAEQAVDEVVRAIGLLVGKRAGAPEGSRVAITLTGPVHRRILVAVEGRAALVDGFDGPPTVELTTDSSRFVRLACGRVPETEVATAFGVAISGDEELGRRIVANLSFTI
jgi:uncharacterized protein (TIGR03083 family)